jgi:hypothetical protein
MNFRRLRLSHCPATEGPRVGRGRCSRTRSTTSLAAVLAVAFALGLALPNTAAVRALALDASSVPGGLEGAGAPMPARASAARPHATSGAATAVLLPVIGQVGDDDLCSAWIALQNVGGEATKAVVLYWGPAEPGATACEQAPGPVKVECSGLIRPGATWNLMGDQVATNARSALALSFTARRLSEIGVTGIADDVVADWFCRRLGEVGEDGAFADLATCAQYAALKTAFDSGAVFEGVPMDRAVGAPLAAEVHRSCPADVVAGAIVTSAYEGVGSNALGTPDGATNRYGYYAPSVEIDRATGPVSTLHVQNAGTTVASVDVWAHDRSSAGKLCGTLQVPPGASVPFHPETCQPAPLPGAVRLESTQPLAVAVDAWGRDAQTTYTAAPGSVGRDAAGATWPVGDQTAAFGPLAHDPRYGWESEIAVQNHSGTRSAEVTVTFHDAAGAVVASADRTIQPHAVETVVLPISDGLPGLHAGTVRVVSKAPPSDPSGGPVPVSAVATLTRFSDEARTGIYERMAYALSPSAATRSGSGDGADGMTSGAAAVALPLVAMDLDGFGVGTEIVLANQVPDPGWTDVAVLVYDQNALADVMCRRLGAMEVDYITLGYSGVFDNGFIGSALVSAVYWEHLAPAGAGTEVNRVGISAATVTRSRTWTGEDIPGDEVGASVGAPLVALPDAVARAVGDPCDGHPFAPPAPTALPGPTDGALDGQTYLPVIAEIGNDASCAATVTLHNPGAQPAKAVIVWWGEPGFCPPDDAGPLDVACSGLIAPGGDWAMSPGEMGTFEWAYSGIVLSFNTRTLGELGVVPGSPELAVDRLCDALGATLTGGSAAAHRFRTAYDLGLTYQDLPLGRMYGGRLDVTVERQCPDMVSAGVMNTSRYAGVRARTARSTDPRGGGHAYAGLVPVTDSREEGDWIYIQNAGSTCARVTVGFQYTGDCLREREGEILTLAPGEASQLDPNQLVGPGFRGAFSLRSTEPLAVVIDATTPGALRTYPAVTGRTVADVNDDGKVDATDITAFEAARGSTPGVANWNVRADLDGSGTVDQTDRDLMAGHVCGRERAPIADPPPTTGRRADFVALPALQAGALGAVCPAQVAVQNVGDRDAKAALLTWGRGTSDAGACDAPISIVCTGLLRPGGTWHLDVGADPGRHVSGMLFSFGTATLGDLGVTPGSTELAADRVCAELHTAVVGDCAAYTAFKMAFDVGAGFAGVPLDRLRGPGLAAQVERVCPGTARVSAGYEGIGANALGALDDARGGFVYHVPLIYTDRAGFDTTLHIQNAGDMATSAVVWAVAQDDCTGERAVADWWLDAGESVSVDLRDHLGPGMQGAVRVTAGARLAVVADYVGRGIMFSTRAVPSRTDVDAAGRPVLAAASNVLYGPLTYDPEGAWDVGVQVYNLDYRHPARVHVEFRDDRGAVLFSLDDRICYAGTQTFFSPVINALPSGRVGSVRVESVRTVDDPGVAPAPIAGIITMLRYSDAQRSEALAAVGYNLVAEPDGATSGRSAGADGLAGGVGVVALPGIGSDPGGPGSAARIAINNLVLAPGWTDAALLLYDQNGLVDVVCRQIEAGDVAYIDLATTGVPRGFVGGAVVSAASWHHVVRGGTTGVPRNLVGLAAALELRHGTGDGEIAGDETSVSVGIPLRRLPWAAGQAVGDLCGGPVPTLTPTPVTPTPEWATPTPPPPSATPRISPTAGSTVVVPAATPTDITSDLGTGRAFVPFAQRGR